MDITKDIPAQTGVTHRIQTISFNLEDKMAYCHIEIYDSEGMHVHSTSVDVMPILATATDPQKAVIRGFFKQIIAAGVAVALGSVPEIFTE